jgi:hypothetical protein
VAAARASVTRYADGVTDLSPNTHGLLRLTMVPGLGPVLISRLLREMGSAEAVLRASPSALRSVRGIGDAKAKLIEDARPNLDRLADEETRVAADAGVRLIGLGDAEYPVLLSHIDDPPPVLYVRGDLRWRGSGSGDAGDRWLAQVLSLRARAVAAVRDDAGAGGA